MRILDGTKVVDAGPRWRDAVSERRVVIDLGAGDARWVYDSARSDPESVYIAVDPDADALREYAYRASRKPSRGGVANASFVVASVEQLPPELLGMADLVRVNFPWGGLLRGLIEPRDDVLRAIASLGKVNARFEIVLAYMPEHDTGAFAGGPLPALEETRLKELEPAYAEAGLIIEDRRRLTQDEALTLPSTWGRRLLHARPRPVFLLSGHLMSPGEKRPS